MLILKRQVKILTISDDCCVNSSKPGIGTPCVVKKPSIGAGAVIQIIFISWGSVGFIIVGGFFGL